MSEEEIRDYWWELQLNDVSQKAMNYFSSLEKEIERLKGVYKKNLELVDKMYSKDKEIERLHSIIKEVREYIEDIMKKYIDYELAIDGVHILEILDKENI